MAVPQRLRTETVDAFRVIYEEEFGVSISIEQAEAMAVSLLELFDLLINAPD
jgi:hypothetical protein